MPETVDHTVRAWILTMPGLITASSPSEALEKARVACGVVDFSVEEFAAALNRSGYVPRQVRDQFRLVFPEPSRIAPHHV